MALTFTGGKRQPGLRTVQQVLEAALEQLTGDPTITTASGRTDAGVHRARAGRPFPHRRAPYPGNIRSGALNALAPRDVRVLDAEEKPQAFHATLDAKSKRYPLRDRQRVDRQPVPASI